MREELRKKILPNFVELIQATNLHEATDEFQSAGYITNSDAETVEHEKTMKMKNKVLINILLTKPDLLFEKLLHWLFREEHSELARKLAEDVCDTADFELEMVKAHTIALDYLTEMYIPTKDGLVELKDTVAGTLGRILSENLYLTHTQCEILVKKVLNKHFSVEFISKEERKGCSLVRGLKLKGATQYDSVKIKETVTDSGAAFKRPLTSESTSQLTVNFHINKVHIHDKNGGRKEPIDQSKLKSKVSKENSSSQLRKIKKQKKGPIKRLINNTPSPPSRCITRKKISAEKGRKNKSPQNRNEKCGCGENAIKRVTKKGPNKGRGFYTCETDRCDFFKWSDAITPKSSPVASALMCECKQEARRYKVLKENQNKGRYFYGCPLPKGQQCDFFEWDDKKRQSFATEDPLPFKAEKKKRNKRKCSICNQEGHNKKNCPHNVP